MIDVGLYLEYLRLKNSIATAYAAGSSVSSAQLVSLKSQTVGNGSCGTASLSFETPRYIEDAASRARTDEEVIALRKEFEALKQKIALDVRPIDSGSAKLRNAVDGLLVFKKNTALELAEFKTHLETLRISIRWLQAKNSEDSAYARKLGEVEGQVSGLLAKTRETYDQLYG
ncbi:TPA: hypothetical protein HA318_00115 [Candidatus Micrarchaeota archaeon]|nr:hypothetical protein [Candidatus Micrarchaeota archaeon]